MVIDQSIHILAYYIFPFVLVLGILIFVHELGHFLVAKYFGVKVLKFSLGFGPKLIGKKLGETEYLISLLPLGGYVKMLGENDEEDEAPLTPEEEKKSFSHKPVGQRIAIVAAGPIFNLGLALFTFCLFYMFAGNHVLSPEIGEVKENAPAYVAGLLKGDLIVAIDGQQTGTWPELKEMIKGNTGEPVEITIMRNDELRTIKLTPEISVTKNIFGEDIKTPLIGIVASGVFKKISYTPLEAVRTGFLKTWEIIKLTFLTVVKLIQRIIPLKTVGGPIFIGQMTGQLAEKSWTHLIPFLAIISINLGILNLLPIPVLDGGVIFFLLIELIMGRPLNLKGREVAQKIGISLLLLFMVVVIYNDVTRFFE
jgi:regulator of sigma E protease